MLRIDIENPIQLTIVKADPTLSGGALAALSAENWGESPMTARPQISINNRKRGAGSVIAKGESKQQTSDTESWLKATRALPRRLDARPPTAQLRKPAPIIVNVISEIPFWSTWPFSS